MGQLKNISLVTKISKKLKQLRQSKELTQEQVFIDTGIHIGRIESASTNISISTLEFLCKYYGKTLAEFFKDLDV